MQECFLPSNACSGSSLVHCGKVKQCESKGRMWVSSRLEPQGASCL